MVSRKTGAPSMIRLRFLPAALLAASLLSGCGNTDSSKDAKQKPADQSKPGDQTPKKDADDKHKSSHEPG
jgi:hypothetical protein